MNQPSNIEKKTENPNFWSRIGKIRPQVLMAIVALSVISVIALVQGNGDMIAVATGCTGGIIALGMKLLESE